jgi:hypothetical protein
MAMSERSWPRATGTAVPGWALLGALIVVALWTIANLRCVWTLFPNLHTRVAIAALWLAATRLVFVKGYVTDLTVRPGPGSGLPRGRP